MNNIFGIYKPKGPTSNQVLTQLKKITNIKKIGHAGTLDPLATGVLVVGIGRDATKQLGDLVQKEKEYLAKIKFGMTSTTDDEEGEKTEIKVSKVPEINEVEKVAQSFVGNILQMPPVFSAVKAGGKKAYQLARQGRKPQIGPRNIEIKKIDIIKYDWPYLELNVTTGPGAYIRSLARDIGEKLGVGGYLAELERTRVGEFDKKKSITIDEFKKIKL